MITVSPSQQEHKEQACVNLEVASFMEEQDIDSRGGPAYDWVVTTLFYAALHLIESKLAEQDLHCSSHYQRRKAVHNCLPSISDHYQDLYHASRSARYNCETIDGEDAACFQAVFAHIADFITGPQECD